MELVRRRACAKWSAYRGAVEVARSAGIERSTVEEILDLVWKEESGGGDGA